MNDLALGSTVWLPMLVALGGLPILTIAAARMLHRRPAQAHAVLVAGLAATLAAPVLAMIVAAIGLGVLPGPDMASAAGVAFADEIAAAVRPGGWSWLIAPVLGTAWFGVSATLFVRLGRSFRRSWRVVGRSETIACPEVRATVTRAVDREGRREVVVALSDDVASPAILCWCAPPRLLVPAHLRGWLVGERLEAVVRHEVAHDARRDHWWRLLADLGVCVLPWHPLVHVLRHRIRRTSELACDALAVADASMSARYADTLLRLAPRCVERAPRLVAAHFASDLAVRIETLLRGRVASPRAGGRWIAGTTLAALAVVGAAALAQPRPVRFDADPAWNAADLEAAPVRVFPGVLDLGVVAPGDVGRGTLRLANLGHRSAHVVAARAGCGCTTIDPFTPRSLAPGETMTLAVTMRAPDAPGTENRKTVEIVFDDQEKLVATVRLVTTAP